MRTIIMIINIISKIINNKNFYKNRIMNQQTIQNRMRCQIKNKKMKKIMKKVKNKLKILLIMKMCHNKQKVNSNYNQWKINKLLKIKIMKNIIKTSKM